MRGLDDGPDGLREDVFDRAMAAPIGAKPKRARKPKRSDVAKYSAELPAHLAPTPVHAMKRVEDVKPDVVSVRQAAGLGAEIGDIVKFYERIDRSTASLYAAYLTEIALLPCTTATSEWGCGACLAARTLASVGELRGIWDLFELIREACRG